MWVEGEDFFWSPAVCNLRFLECPFVFLAFSFPIVTIEHRIIPQVKIHKQTGVGAFYQNSQFKNMDFANKGDG